MEPICSQLVWLFLPWEIIVIMADAGGGNIIFIRGLSEIITNKSTLLESLGPRL